MKKEMPPTIIEKLKLRHIRTMRIVSTFGLILCLVFNWTTSFVVALVVYIISFQLSIQKWELEWSKKEKEEENNG